MVSLTRLSVTLYVHCLSWFVEGWIYPHRLEFSTVIPDIKYPQTLTSGTNIFNMDSSITQSTLTSLFYYEERRIKTYVLIQEAHRHMQLRGSSHRATWMLLFMTIKIKSWIFHIIIIIIIIIIITIIISVCMCALLAIVTKNDVIACLHAYFIAERFSSTTKTSDENLKEEFDITLVQRHYRPWSKYHIQTVLNVQTVTFNLVDRAKK